MNSAPANAVIRQLPGRVCWHKGERLLIASGHSIAYSRDGGKTQQFRVSLPTRWSDKLKSWNNLGARLLRSGVAEIVPLSETNFLVHYARQLFLLDSETGKIKPCGPLPQHNALRISFDGRRIVYGEYFANRERGPVNIWVSDNFGASWTVAVTFLDTRHIHAVLPDPFADGFWVTCGDLDHESHLRFLSSDFSTATTHHSGCQDFRAIEMLFDETEILYATDTHLAGNKLFTMERGNLQPNEVQTVGGSVFYLRRYGEFLVATTAVEPSEANPSRDCEVWLRDPTKQWRLLKSFRKDRWSMKYFGFGRVDLPHGNGSEEGVWVSPCATAGDGTSYLLAYPDS